MRGKRQLKLLSRGETYEMNSPNLLIRILPTPGVDWDGDVRIRCPENGLEAELHYGHKSFLGLRGSHRSVKGKILETSTKRTLFEFNGNWDRYLPSRQISDVRSLSSSNFPPPFTTIVRSIITILSQNIYIYILVKIV